MCGENTPKPNEQTKWQETGKHAHLMCHIRFPLSITNTHRAIKERMQRTLFTLNDVQFGCAKC